MKKNLFTTLLAGTLCAATAVSFSACGLFDGPIESEGTVEASADGKEDCTQLLNDFFAETLKQTNMVVTTKGNGEVQTTESIDGEKGKVEMAATGATVYTFLDGGEYYYGFLSDDGSKYLQSGKELYDQYHPYFMSTFAIFDMIPADEATFAANYVINEKETIDGENSTYSSTGEMNFEITAEGGKLTVTAEAKDGLVQKYTVVNDTKGEETRTSESTFVYGTASFTVPEKSAFEYAEVEEEWETTESTEEFSAEGKEDTLQILNEFFENTRDIPNKIATTSHEEDAKEDTRVEKVDGDKSVIESSDGSKTYTFIDGDKYITATESESFKIYTVSEEIYNKTHNNFLSFLTTIESLDETAGKFELSGTRHEVEKTNGEDYLVENDATLRFTFTAGTGSITVDVTQEDNLVTDIQIIVDDENGERVTYVFLEYGGAEVEVPDISDWYDATNDL